MSKVKPVKASERPRESTYPMISVSEALECVLQESTVLKTKTTSFGGCFSYVTAEAISAGEPYPPFPASIKDGYAVLAEDVSEIREVIGSVTPGCKLDFDMRPGSCVRVSTGSAVPDQANAVIQVEDTAVEKEDEEGNEIKIKILKPAAHNQDIRAIGSDVSSGQVLIPSNKKITSAEIGILATCGVTNVLVYEKPKVALLSTGDEVLEWHEALLPGCIRDSNKSSLFYALKENRIPVFDVGIAKDEADDVKTHLTTAFEKADIVVTTGGVSMGERDILKQVLVVDFNAVIHFGRIKMKPGKPCTFSSVTFKNEKKLVFSLPGNPVSACVCFHLFVVPCLKKMMGDTQPMHSTLKVKLAHDIKLDERPEFYRASLKCNDEGIYEARGTGAQQSSRLLSMQNADALLVLPPKTPEQTQVKAGSTVEAILLSPM